MYFSHEQVFRVLLESEQKHVKVLRESITPEHERVYSRNCIFHVRELRKLFEALEDKRGW
jgi:hypothetical protein